MLIRTQDKLTLVNLDQVKEIRILKDCVTKNIKCEFADGTGRFIGTYSTEERALEVLDLIEMDYMANCKICNMPQEEEI